MSVNEQQEDVNEPVVQDSLSNHGINSVGDEESKSSNNNNNSNDDDLVIISDEMSKRICTHMNDDHSISVYCMAKAIIKSNPELKSSIVITNNSKVILKNVTMTNCTIQIITCNEKTNSCEMNTIDYPFIPSLQTPADIRKRMVQIHHTVLQPLTFFTSTSPAAVILSITQLGLLYMTIVMTSEQRLETCQQLVNLIPTITTIPIPIQLVQLISDRIPIFTKRLLLLHFIEADIVVLLARIQLKLSSKATIKWFIYTLLYGILVSIPFLQLVYRNYQHNNKHYNNKKTH